MLFGHQQVFFGDVIEDKPEPHGEDSDAADICRLVDIFSIVEEPADELWCAKQYSECHAGGQEAVPSH